MPHNSTIPSRLGFGLIVAGFLLCRQQALAQEPTPVYPGKEWEPVQGERIGYSTLQLDALRTWLKTQSTTGLFVTVRGRKLFEYGDTKHVSLVASVRKSVLGMLYGTYVANGLMDLRKTVKELGLDDVEKFLPREEGATLETLLTSRSGIYHPNGAPEDDLMDSAPARGSQMPGAFFYYNNWDFDAAGTAFEKVTKKGIYEIDRQMVEQSGELHLLPFLRCLAHTRQPLGHAPPALCRVRAGLMSVLLDQQPSLLTLRQRLPVFVRMIHRYCSAVPTPRTRACGPYGKSLFPPTCHGTLRHATPRSPGSRA